MQPDRQLAAFLIVSFGWSWSIFVIGVALGIADSRWLFPVIAWGPLIGAAVVIWWSGEDLRAWVKQVLPRRGVRWWWLLVAILVPFLMIQADAVVAAIVGVPISVVDLDQLVTTFLITLLLAGALEEFGWRGFLQPRLQTQRSALTAAVVVGVVWGLWHMPLVLSGRTPFYAPGDWVEIMLACLVFSIPMAWLYNSTRGGLGFVMVFHAMINATPIVVAATRTTAMELGAVLALFGIPLAIVLRYGRRDLATARPDPPIPG